MRRRVRSARGTHIMSITICYRLEKLPSIIIHDGLVITGDNNCPLVQIKKPTI